MNNNEICCQINQEGVKKELEKLSESETGNNDFHAQVDESLKAINNNVKANQTNVENRLDQLTAKTGQISETVSKTTKDIRTVINKNKV